MFQLPQVLQSFIYEFDSTYRKQFEHCLPQIQKMNPMANDIFTSDQIVDEDIIEFLDIDCEDFSFLIYLHMLIDGREIYEYNITRKNEWKDFSKASRKLLSQTLVSTFPTMSQDPDHNFSFNFYTEFYEEVNDGTLEDYYELFNIIMAELRAEPPKPCKYDEMSLEEFVAEADRLLEAKKTLCELRDKLK